MADVEHAGHRIRIRERSRRCGRRCSGCPHPAVVVEVTFPSGRTRELWGEPPDHSGRRPGAPRTRQVEVPEKTSRSAERDDDAGEQLEIFRVDDW